MPRGLEITGRLAADPEEFTTNSGRKMVGFPLIDNNRYYDREAGEFRDGQAERYSVTRDHDQFGDNILSSLKKGDLVTVEGNLTPKAYIDNNGEARVNNQLWANEVTVGFPQKLSRGPLEPKGPEASAQQAEVSHEAPTQQAAQEQATPATGAAPPFVQEEWKRQQEQQTALDQQQQNMAMQQAHGNAAGPELGR